MHACTFSVHSARRFIERLDLSLVHSNATVTYHPLQLSEAVVASELSSMCFSSPGFVYWSLYGALACRFWHGIASVLSQACHPLHTAALWMLQCKLRVELSPQQQMKEEVMYEVSREQCAYFPQGFHGQHHLILSVACLLAERHECLQIPDRLESVQSKKYLVLVMNCQHPVRYLIKSNQWVVRRHDQQSECWLLPNCFE